MLLLPIIALTGFMFTPIDNPPIDASKFVIQKTLSNKELVEKYSKKYGIDSQLALRIGYCESGLRSNAKNKNSSASGVYQHLSRYRPARAKKYGFAGASVFNAEANIAVSMGMLRDQGTSPRNASKHCWGKPLEKK